MLFRSRLSDYPSVPHHKPSTVSLNTSCAPSLVPLVTSAVFHPVNMGINHCNRLEDITFTESCSGKTRYLFRQGIRDKLQIEGPGVTEFDLGILRPQMVEDFGNLNL